MTRDYRKRRRDNVPDDNRVGLGETVAHIRESGHEGQSYEVVGVPMDMIAHDDGAGEWQYFEGGRAKKRRKEERSYPSISHSSHARLNSFVKLGDVQNLILYLLADGTAPHWCAVRHHSNVRKVVALMVPGLEPGMFDGTIPLMNSEGSLENGNDNDAVPSADTSNSQHNADRESPSNAISHTSVLQPVTNGKSSTSPDDYYPRELIRDRLSSPLQPISDIFEHVWPVKTPGDNKYSKMHSPLAAMLISPIEKDRKDKNSKGPQAPATSKTWKNERTPVTEFIATTEELAEQNYVLHPAHYTNTSLAAVEAAKRESDKKTVAGGWIDTPNISTLMSSEVVANNIDSATILAGANVLAMDCEMCITSPPGIVPQVFSLTRIAIIDWDGNIVLDEFVKPNDPITDYLTPYSGITAAKLENVTTSLKDIQIRLVNEILTPQTIIVGHSLESDFNALRLTHPYIIDTTLLFPHPRGPPLKSSLKWLAQKYLSREIQTGHGTTGHDSIEDARACLDLVKQKCEKGKAWGTSEASGESIFKRLGRHIRPKRDKVNSIGDDEPRTGAVVDWGDPNRGYGGHAKVAIGCESDEQVVASVNRAIKGDDDESVVPRGGVDFVFGRLRELEAFRGWWNRSKTVDNEALRNTTTSNSESESLSSATARAVAHIQDVWEHLPPCTAFLVFSGSGDPRELSEMQALQQKFKDEYRVKKWDELSVKWTDVEEQKLRKACEDARIGVGFVRIK